MHAALKDLSIAPFKTSPLFEMKMKHQHIDLAFLAHPRGVANKKKEVVEENLKWFSLQEIEELAEDEIFHDVKAIINNILSPEKLKATPDR